MHLESWKSRGGSFGRAFAQDVLKRHFFLGGRSKRGAKKNNLDGVCNPLEF